MNIIIIIYILSLLVGVFLVLGTILKLKILVDPPEDWASFYSHSSLKKRFGSEFLVVFNYIVGSLFIAFSILFFVAILSGNVMY